MSRSRHSHPADDVDLAALGAALWRAKGWIFGLALGAGVVTFLGLSMVRPLYTSEARILVQNEESAFTRPTSDSGRDPRRAALDEQAVQSQVQVLTSRDLLLQVVKDLDLTNDPAFAKDAGQTPLKRLLTRLGLGRGSPESEEERAATALADHLSVFQLSKSSVIAVEYSSGDPKLAARIANTLADVYIGWQRSAKIEQTKDATAWLEAQIEALRKATAQSEEAAEAFHAKEGLYAGSNNVTLNAQQLSELNSQLILAEAQRSEAQARAKLIKQMLADNGDIDATPEVLKSQLIINLIEQRVLVQRQLAELSATLLPSHPRIQQLRSELADVRAQIRDEGAKVVKSLENEAQVAAAREASLRASLNAAKSTSAGLGDSEIKLRALEREAKANRDLLESYLARYRDASARHDMGAVPAQAAIVSRAHAPVQPSFPKRGPLSLLVIAATALMATAYTLARELIAPPARRPMSQAKESHTRQHRRPERTPPAPAEPVVSSIPASKIRPAAAVKSSPPGKSAPHAAEPVRPARNLPVVIPPKTPEPAQAKTEPKPPEQVITGTEAAEPTGTPPAFQAKEPPKRPSWLRVSTPRRPHATQRVRRETEIPETNAEIGTAPIASEAAPEPAPAGRVSQQAPQEPAAAGLLDRLRQEFAEGTPGIGTAAKDTTLGRATGFLDRFRRGKAAEEESPPTTPETPSSKGIEMAALSPNDLRHYLTQRIASPSLDEPAATTAKTKGGSGKAVPVLKSLDAVLEKVLAAATGGLPRALLVAGTSPKANATHLAIGLARALADHNEQVVLVDLAKGASAVSGPLGMPRVPGFTDLAAGLASFAEVIRVDDETPLQVITTGNPATRGQEPEPDCFMRVFEALTQAYGCVVLHADMDAVQVLMPALKFELPVMVAVLPPGAGLESEERALSTFQALGCPVVAYEGNGKSRRMGLFSRSAAV